MKQVTGLFKLGRPFSTLTGAMTTILGGYVAGTGEWLNIGLAGLVTYLVSMSAFAWNDYLDVEIDKINQPQRPIPSGLVSPRNAWLFAAGMTTFALIIAWFINYLAFIVALLSSFMLYFYSWKLKSTVLVGNITTASIAALSAVFGGVAAGNPGPSLWLAMIVLTAITAREILKTLADYEGDLHQRCRTVATVWGRPIAKFLFWIVAFATLLVMMVPYLLDVFRPIYAYIVVLGVYPVIVYIMIGVARRKTGHHIEQLSQLLKYDFLVWFLAVVLGAAA